jgi:tRNA 2-thiocytidine biosynthesis protein TtcA
VPCACSERTGTVRRSLRGLFTELEKEYPHIKETMLSAMGNVDTSRLLDPRLLGQLSPIDTPEIFPILSES